MFFQISFKRYRSSSESENYSIKTQQEEKPGKRNKVSKTSKAKGQVNALFLKRDSVRFIYLFSPQKKFRFPSSSSNSEVAEKSVKTNKSSPSSSYSDVREKTVKNKELGSASSDSAVDKNDLSNKQLGSPSSESFIAEEPVQAGTSGSYEKRVKRELKSPKSKSEQKVMQNSRFHICLTNSYFVSFSCVFKWNLRLPRVKTGL